MQVCPFICKPFSIIFAYQRIITIFARVEIVIAHELHPNAGGVHGLFCFVQLTKDICLTKHRLHGNKIKRKVYED